MAIYEPEDFDKALNPKQMKHNKAIDKLKRMRLKKKEEEEQKSLYNVPTSEDLSKWINFGD